MRRLTIVICNYNYARYVAESVESALAVRWPDVEVIVVDDGSTDESLAVLRAFAGRIRLITSSNRGQRSAVNLGYESATGEAILFLDSDDVLPPEVASAAAAAFGPGVSKVQFRMQRIDADGHPIGRPFPSFARTPTPAQIRTWVTASTAYPTPPASGNVYARWFLDRVMPQGPEIGAFADSGLLATAPLLGDVVTARDVVVGYRRHGANDSAMRRDPSNFHRECRRASDRWNHALRVTGRPPDPERVFRSREVLQFRAAAARSAPRRFLPGDGRRRIVADALRSPAVPGPEPVLKRLAIAAWSLAVVAAPRAMAARLIDLRFGKAS